ncbi:hypothetical protein DPMN_095513 [Dreissena polymorpha]|uniref:EF-hand domain-containing protein n=1 Tax=Dreissena polymorpha TaxID=45954 RepID=A0A9D4R2T8_DREPO|nr:hypothetical protein DPMN_095513 [Dreissena polymorpha]
MAHPLSEHQIVELKDAFALFDKNNDGFINFTELKDMLISMGTDTPNWKVRHVLNDVDQDGESRWSRVSRRTHQPFRHGDLRC